MGIFDRGATRFNICTASLQIIRFMAEKSWSGALDYDGALRRY
jgi:hypothetical protein